MLSVFLANAKSQHYGGINIFSDSLHLMNCATETLMMGTPKKGLGFLMNKGPKCTRTPQLKRPQRRISQGREYEFAVR